MKRGTKKLSTPISKSYNQELMSRCLLIATVTCLSICSTLQAQRLFATVDPSALEENLTFDINDIPLTNTGSLAPVDLNFSPNVVFSLDSSKAFVSYPGSNKVLVFDPIEGKPLEPAPLIEVGENPALMTLTPDGNTLAVVCLFLADNLPQSGEIFVGKQIGIIALIDVDTLAVRRIDLTEVFFSFANNIVFSEDSKTGFLASSGTDEILRFDVDSATEITPRLNMISGTRPSSITITPDFSAFVAVLVGSDSLPQQDVADSLQIIDVDSFTVTRSIVPTVGDQGFPPHNFFASNTLAISPDGMFGLIADQELSSLGLLEDHAILLNLQTGETVQQFNIGRLSGPSFSVPGGKRFVTISASEIIIIDIQALTVFRVAPPPLFSGFRATTRPVFFRDGTGMFVAAALRDSLLEFDLRTGTARHSVDLGPSVSIEQNGIAITVPAAPLDLAWSPDGSVLSAVKFNANTVALLKETDRIFVPRLLSDEEFFTGIALTNNSSQEATLIARGVGPSGSQLLNDPDTDATQDFTTPQTITLGAGQQTSFTIRELIEATPESTVDAWLDIDSDQFAMAGFFLVGDLQLQRLDGGLVNFNPSAELVLPEVRVSNGFRTEITVLNPNLTPVDVELSLINSEGETLEEIVFLLGGNFVFRGFLRDADPEDNITDALFPDTTFQDFIGGYVRIFSEEGVIAFERYFDNQQLASLNGIPVGSDVELPLELYLPQVVAFADSETLVNLVHSGTESASVTLSLKGDQGEDLAAPVNLEMEPAQSIKRNLVELFNLVDPGSAFSGWVLIETDVAGIVGNAELHSVSGQTMTAIPIQMSPMGSFVFSHVAQGLGFSTSLALLNPGPATAIVQVEVHASDGTLLDNLSISIAPSNRELRFLKDLFPNLPDLLGGYIKVSSDQNIIGLEFFHADNLDFLASLPAQSIDPVF